MGQTEDVPFSCLSSPTSSRRRRRLRAAREVFWRHAIAFTGVLGVPFSLWSLGGRRPAVSAPWGRPQRTPMGAVFVSFVIQKHARSCVRDHGDSPTRVKTEIRPSFLRESFHMSPKQPEIQQVSLIQIIPMSDIEHVCCMLRYIQEHGYPPPLKPSFGNWTSLSTCAYFHWMHRTVSFLRRRPSGP